VTNDQAQAIFRASEQKLIEALPRVVDVLIAKALSGNIDAILCICDRVWGPPGLMPPLLLVEAVAAVNAKNQAAKKERDGA
jgi:hypothetical protein